MNRRKFMKSAFVGGIICAIGTKSIGKTIVEEKKNSKRDKLIDYLDNGGTLSKGMYIAFGLRFDSMTPTFTYKIIKQGSNHIGLYHISFNDDSGVKVEVEDTNNISKKEICSLLNEYHKTFSDDKYWFDDDKKNKEYYSYWIMLELEDILKMMDERKERIIKLYG